MAKDDAGAAGEDYGFNLVFLRRAWHLQPVLFPGLLSRNSAVFAALLALAGAEQFLAYLVGLIPGEYYQALGSRDLPGFESVTARSLAVLAAMVAVKSARAFAARSLTVGWRRSLTSALHAVYFSDVRYYRLNVLQARKGSVGGSASVLDNPDQRMTADVLQFCSSYGSILVDLALAPFTIAYYSYSAYSRAGWPGPTAMFGLFAASTFINKLLMTPVVRATVERERREGDLRFKHVAVRTASESLAFHGSATVEAAKTGDKLRRLCDVQQTVFNRQLALDLATNGFDYLGSIASYLVIAVPIFAGDYSDLDPPALSRKISENSFVCMYLVYQFSKLADLATAVTGMAGATHRVVELAERLAALGSAGPHKLFKEGREKDENDQVPLGGDGDDKEGGDDSPLTDSELVDSQDNLDSPADPGDVGEVLFELEDVSVGVPDTDRILISRLSLTIRRGENLMIMGRSSAGKSSLLRVLRGLWPVAGGRLDCRAAERGVRVFFLPQKPFFTNGSLREQVTYPRPSSGSVEDGGWLETTLEELGLSELLSRCGGDPDADPGWDWSDALSPGEAQRLAFARLLRLARPGSAPVLAFLDEATSALSSGMEAELYGRCAAAGVTVVSVGHREGLVRFHSRLLRVAGDAQEGSWTLENAS